MLWSEHLDTGVNDGQGAILEYDGCENRFDLLRCNSVARSPTPHADGAEELSVDNFIAWTVGALGYLALMGLIYFIVVLTSAPDR